MFNIKSASIAQLREFATNNQIVVEGDRRFRETFEKAIALFLSAKDAVAELVQETIAGAVECVQEVATYDNAVIAANFANVWSRRTTRFFAEFLWSAFLITIALVMLAIDVWQNRNEAIVQIWERGAKLKRAIVFRYWKLRTEGYFVLQVRVVDPVLDWRDRIRSAIE